MAKFSIFFNLQDISFFKITFDDFALLFFKIFSHLNFTDIY